MVDTSNLVFFLNGTLVCLENVDPTVLLIDYLRLPEVGLTGTKLVCGEGGCGACTVVMAHKDRGTGQVVERPVNACLRPLCGVDGRPGQHVHRSPDPHSGKDRRWQWFAVWILYARMGDVDVWAAEKQSPADLTGSRRLLQRQPVPLHRVQVYSQRYAVIRGRHSTAGPGSR